MEYNYLAIERNNSDYGFDYLSNLLWYRAGMYIKDEMGEDSSFIAVKLNKGADIQEVIDVLWDYISDQIDYLDEEPNRIDNDIFLGSARIFILPEDMVKMYMFE